LLLTIALLGTCLFVGQALSEEKAKPADKANPAREGQANMFRPDGDWTVVYASMDGKKLEDKSMSHVSIRNGVLTCKHDGKERSWRLTFQPGHMVWATESAGAGPAAKGPETKGTENRDKEKGTQEARPLNVSDVRAGVYIAAPDFLCLGLDKIASARPGVPGVPGTPVTPPRPGTTTTPGAPALPGTAVPPGAPAAPVLPEAQAQAAQQAFSSGFVLILKRNTQKSETPR